MIPITQALLTNHNRPKFKLKKLKGIVIHWTANTNPGANALANRNYFNTTKNSCSAHYVVDDYRIIQCIPDDEVAYHVGAKSYTAIGQAMREGSYSPNYYTIGIEMCVNSDGDWNKTYRNMVELVVYLLSKYDVPLYRHYDITGKDCPKMMIDQDAWTDFKEAVKPTAWKDIVRLKLSDPEGWINDIEAMVKAAEAEGNQGIYERLKYLPTLIEKIYRE
jgi:N-acetylmuramoyl-L-alanine amidase CwlA